MMEVLAAHAAKDPIEILRADPEEQARFHYREDGRSLNSVRGRSTLRAFLAALHDQERRDRRRSIVARALIAERYVTGSSKAHPMPLVPASALPRLWIGNAARVTTHGDPIKNVAVSAAGRRRFTLFPPDAEVQRPGELLVGRTRSCVPAFGEGD